MEQEIELEQENIVINSGGGAVNSVNGYTGDVILTTSDLENTSDYQTGTEVDAAIATAIAGKQDTLTAGDNITITNNVIAATDTTYTAGNGINISNTNEISADTTVLATQQNLTDEATARENADISLQGQIDAISASSDVTDIVGTYAELQAYDTSKLKDNDIIKVLQDESQNDETTYYRWSITTQTFTLIGEEGPYYTKSATDTLLAAKQDTLTAGSNITISAQNEISATDTTYTAGNGLDLTGTVFSADTTVLATQTDLAGKQNTLTAGSNITISNDTISATDTTYSPFTGTDGVVAGTSGLVPAPATTDAGKFLKADGTWDTAGGGGDTVYSTKTTSLDNYGGAVYIGNKDSNQVAQLDPTTTDNHYKYFWALPGGTNPNNVVPENGTIAILGLAEPGNSYGVAIGFGAQLGLYSSASVALGFQAKARANASNGIAIGENVDVSGENGIGIGGGVNVGSQSSNCVAIGYAASCYQSSSVALGKGAYPTRQGEVNVGCDNTTAFNNTTYRVIGGVHDGQDLHDAATKGQLDRAIINGGTTAPTTSTVGAVGTLYSAVVSNTAHLYVCTAIDTTDPQNPSYTWTVLV